MMELPYVNIEHEYAYMTTHSNTIIKDNKNIKRSNCLFKRTNTLVQSIMAISNSLLGRSKCTTRDP